MDDLDHNEQEQILSPNEKDVLLPQTDAAPPVMTQIFLVFAPSLSDLVGQALGCGTPLQAKPEDQVQELPGLIQSTHAGIWTVVQMTRIRVVERVGS